MLTAAIRTEGGTINWAPRGEAWTARADQVDDRHGAAHFVWIRHGLRIDLTVAEADTNLSNGSVARLFIGVWHLAATGSTDPPELACWLADTPTPLDGGASNGEWLDAGTWKSGDGWWSIGTEDSEALLCRAKTGDMLPSRWTDWLDFFETNRSSDQAQYPTECVPNGLVIRLPEIHPDEIVRVHQAAAWTTNPSEPETLATWDAVNLTISERFLRDRAVWKRLIRRP